MKRDIRIEKIFHHRKEKIWKLIADSNMLAEWLMPNDLKPVVGHKFNFKTKPAPGFDGIVHCEVLEVIEFHKLVFSWKGGPIKKPTIVSWILEDIPGGTKLTFSHTGFEGFSPVAISYLLGRGWKKNITSLFDKKLNEMM
ncbi:MAG TPA: SRPBCC domain-containing protein [Chitinophagaceae bacterium]|nr:SRPBCC domain-containing protein [Chitinophagaceae bacterium]